MGKEVKQGVALEELYPRFYEFDWLCNIFPEFSTFRWPLYFKLGILMQCEDKTIIDMDELLKCVQNSTKEIPESHENVRPLLKFLHMIKVIREAKKTYDIDERMLIEYQLLCIAREYRIDMIENGYDRHQVQEIVESILHIAMSYSKCSKLFYTMYIDVWRDIVENGYSEYEYQQLFKETGASICGGEISEHPLKNTKHIPDAWIKKNEEYIPVEVKLNDFNKSALRQLKRYIKVYDCKRGIAVGRKCTVQLEDNIQFVPLKTLEERGWKDLFFERPALRASSGINVSS